MGRGQRMPEQPKYRNIQLRLTTVEAIKKAGVKGETYDDVISRLLVFHERYSKTLLPEAEQ